MSTTNFTVPGCAYCGCYHTGVCPRVAEIEYHEDGTVKRVKLHPLPQTPPQPLPLPAPYQPYPGSPPYEVWCTVSGDNATIYYVVP